MVSTCLCLLSLFLLLSILVSSLFFKVHLNISHTLQSSEQHITEAILYRLNVQFSKSRVCSSKPSLLVIVEAFIWLLQPYGLGLYVISLPIVYHIYGLQLNFFYFFVWILSDSNFCTDSLNGHKRSDVRGMLKYVMIKFQ